MFESYNAGEERRGEERRGSGSEGKWVPASEIYIRVGSSHYELEENFL